MNEKKTVKKLVELQEELAEDLLEMVELYLKDARAVSPRYAVPSLMTVIAGIVEDTVSQIIRPAITITDSHREAFWTYFLNTFCLEAEDFRPPIIDSSKEPITTD